MTVKIKVFCRPNLSPTYPVMTRLTELTPLDTARRVAPNDEVYPMATEYSAKKVSGRPLPPACRNPAPTLKRKAGFMANLRSTCVGRLPINRDGAALAAIGRAMTSVINDSARSVHLGPIAVKRYLMNGENASPPTPAPERMNPIADPR
jgi:hypothetical protein